MNTGNTSSAYQKASVSTNMLTEWDSAGNQLRIAGMDTGLQISIWKPQIFQNTSRKYPAELRVTCIVNQRNLPALDSIIFNDLMQAYERGVDMKKAIFTNGAKTTLLEIELTKGEFKLNIYQGANSTLQDLGAKSTFGFETVMVIDKIDTVSGECEATPIQADFALFAKAVRGYLDMMSGTICGHGERVTNQFRTDEFMRYLRAIATAVNAQLPVMPWSGNGSFQNKQQSEGNPENPNSSNLIPPIAMEEVDDLPF